MLDFFQYKPQNKIIKTSLFNIAIWIITEKCSEQAGLFYKTANENMSLIACSNLKLMHWLNYYANHSWPEGWPSFVSWPLTIPKWQGQEGTVAQFSAWHGWAFQQALGVGPSRTLGHAKLRNALFHPHPCYPVAASPANIYFLVSLIWSQHCFHVSFWKGLSLGSVFCVCWVRIPHHASKDHRKLSSETRLPRSPGEFIQIAHWLSHFI